MSSDAAEHNAYATWLRSLELLTSSEAAATAFRERRYRFAYELGEALAGTHTGIQGPAVYGVWLECSLLYVGQTLKAERRLRDLAVGESHHLANTFPPEIWHRVGLVAWTSLEQAPEAVARLGEATVGLALEHRLQAWARPLANSARRTRSGGWRQIDRARSRSAGALAAGKIDSLFESVQRLWIEIEREAPAAVEGTVAWVRPARHRDVSR